MDHLVAATWAASRLSAAMAASAKARVRPGREHPEQPRADGQDVDLVDRDPVPDRWRRARRRPPRPRAGSGAGESGRSQKLLAQPGRVGEVVQGDERLQTAIDAPIDDGRVAGQGRPVGVPPLGEDACPLHAQPEAVASESGGAVQRLLGPVPEARRPRPTAPPCPPAPRPPVVRRLAGSVEPALDLESGGGHPEDEAVGAGAPTTRPVVLRSRTTALPFPGTPLGTTVAGDHVHRGPRAAPAGPGRVPRTGPCLTQGGDGSLRPGLRPSRDPGTVAPHRRPPPLRRTRLHDSPCPPLPPSRSRAHPGGHRLGPIHRAERDGHGGGPDGAGRRSGPGRRGRPARRDQDGSRWSTS